MSNNDPYNAPMPPLPPEGYKPAGYAPAEEYVSDDYADDDDESPADVLRCDKCGGELAGCELRGNDRLFPSDPSLQDIWRGTPSTTMIGAVCKDCGYLELYASDISVFVDAAPIPSRHPRPDEPRWR